MDPMEAACYMVFASVLHLFGNSFPEPSLPICFAYYLGPCRKTLHNEGYIIEFPFI